MKNIFHTAALAAFLLAGGMSAEAELSPERLSLGGITVGSTEEYLNAVYFDSPKTVRRAMDAAQNIGVREYDYGGSFFVTVEEETGTVIRLFSIGRHNNIATKDGITIGSTMQEVITAYGYPDLRQIDGESDYYWYFGEEKKVNLVIRLSYGKVASIAVGKR